MNWKEISVSQDWTHFEVNGERIFDRNYNSVLKFHAPGLAPVEEADGWKFIDVEGRVAIPGPFRKAWGFYEGCSAVEDEEGCFHIRANGEFLYGLRYGWCGNFQGGCAAVMFQEGGYAHIDSAGKLLYPARYRYVGDFKNGCASVMLQNGLFKHIDAMGCFFYTAEFLDLGVFHKGYATAKDQKGWHHIDRKGRAIYEERFGILEPFYNGRAFAETLQGEKVVVFEGGRVGKV